MTAQAATRTGSPQKWTPELRGIRALVVGGYGAVGRVVSESLVREGASVAVAGRSAARAGTLAKQLTAASPEGLAATGHDVDVAEPESSRRLVDEVVTAHGGLDVLVNCASVLVVCSAEQFDESDWRTVVDTNLGGAFWLSQAAGRVMIDAGRGGRIVHLSSVRGQAGARRGFAAYGASKAGLNLLVKQLATEWGRHGIGVNAVAPGFMRTEFVEETGSDPRFVQMVTARTPLGRTGETSEVADAVLYLASPRSSFVTGQILFVDGGVTASH